MPKFVLLWTDAAVWLLLATLVGYVWHVRRRPALAANWRRVFRGAAALASSLVLLAFLGVTLMDSVHYRPLLPPARGSEGSPPAYDARTRSLLDALLPDLIAGREATYSRPLAHEGFTKESVLVDGEVRRVVPRLELGGRHLADPAAQWAGDVTRRALGARAALLLSVLGMAVLARGCGGRPFATRCVRSASATVPSPGMPCWPRCGWWRCWPARPRHCPTPTTCWAPT